MLRRHTRLDQFRRTKARLAAIVESSHDAIFGKDLNGIVTDWNPGAERLYGYTAEEMVGRSIIVLAPPERQEEMAWILERIQRGELVQLDDTERVRKDGTRRRVWLNVSPLHGPSGNIIGASTIARDITELKNAQAAQQATAERLAAMNRQKDEFMAMLGHELRNPLAAIRTASELLKLRDDLDPQIQQIRDILVRQSDHMVRLVDGLLDVSRVARGKIQLQTGVLDLRAVLESVLAEREGEAAANGLYLSSGLPPAPAWLEGDNVRLTQVFDNVIGNAIKYTDTGGVHVSLTVSDATATVRVTDTGVGIAPEMQDSIFEPFHQDSEGQSRTQGGLGLGLALARQLVELHGGQIRAESAGKGAGATFVVDLPLSVPRQSSSVATEPTRGARRRVVVVEDNDDAAALLRSLLHSLGHQAWIARDGMAGLDVIREAVPDVVLCDLGLPGMSGYELAEAVREDRNLRDVVLVALSGYALQEHRERTAAAGFDAHLSKPVDAATLESLFSHLLP